MSKAIVRFKLYFFFTNLFLSQKPFLGKFKISRCWIKKSPQIGQCYCSTDFGKTCTCHDTAKETPSSQDITPGHSFFSYQTLVIIKNYIYNKYNFLKKSSRRTPIPRGDFENLESEPEGIQKFPTGWGDSWHKIYQNNTIIYNYMESGFTLKI